MSKKNGLDWLESRKCATCGKTFEVLYPDQYRFKRGRMYFCKYSCMTAYDAEEEKKMSEKLESKRRLTPEQKAKAIEMAMNGISPIPFLKECGSMDASAMWYTIKQNMKKNDPDTYEKLPAQFKPAMKKKQEGNMTPVAFIEKKEEKPKQLLPLQYDGYTVRCIEGKYGKFYWDYEYNRLDWTSPDGEEVSLSPQGWKTFCTEIMPEVMAILGVPDDE